MACRRGFLISSRRLTIADMDSDQASVTLNPLEIEMLLVALDLYEQRIKRGNRPDPAAHAAIRVLRKRLMIAAQRGRHEPSE